VSRTHGEAGRAPDAPERRPTTPSSACCLRSPMRLCLKNQPCIGCQWRPGEQRAGEPFVESSLGAIERPCGHRETRTMERLPNLRPAVLPLYCRFPGPSRSRRRRHADFGFSVLAHHQTGELPGRALDERERGRGGRDQRLVVALQSPESERVEAAEQSDNADRCAGVQFMMRLSISMCVCTGEVSCCARVWSAVQTGTAGPTTAGTGSGRSWTPSRCFAPDCVSWSVTDREAGDDERRLLLEASRSCPRSICPANAAHMTTAQHVMLQIT